MMPLAVEEELVVSAVLRVLSSAWRAVYKPDYSPCHSTSPDSKTYRSQSYSVASLTQTHLPAYPLLLVQPQHLLKEVADHFSIQAYNTDLLDRAWLARCQTKAA
jgi:hypothetical protein